MVVLIGSAVMLPLNIGTAYDLKYNTISSDLLGMIQLHPL